MIAPGCRFVLASLAGTMLAGLAGPQGVAVAATPARAGGGLGAATVHEHGRATLDIAVDGSRVRVRFAAPAADLLGFERAPRTDAERQRLAATRSWLGTADAVVLLPAAAGCRAMAATVQVPEWAGMPAAAPARRPASSAGHQDAAGGAHDHDHEDGHDHDHERGGAGEAGGVHGDLVANHEFDCRSPAMLTSVDVPTRARLDAGVRLDVTVLTATGQAIYPLRHGQSAIALR